MDNLPVHMRIVSLTPTNEDVNARREAIREIATAWKKTTSLPKILGRTEVIAEALGGDGQPSEEIGMEVQTELQKHASAFLYEESPLDVGVCAGMAAVCILGSGTGTDGWSTADVFSNALWSALAFQPSLEEEKRERLRREVLDTAQQRSRSTANQARERSEVNDMAGLTVTIVEENTTTTNFKKATTATIDALRRNAALDREELDFLWWVQLNRSRLLSRPIGDIPEPVRLVASGIEAAGQLRRLPADLHYELVNRTVEVDPELDLSAVLGAIGGDRDKLSDAVDRERIAANPSLFPLLNAIVTGMVEADGATEKRKASEWGGRALLEAGLLRMCNGGIKTL